MIQTPGRLWLNLTMYSPHAHIEIKILSLANRSIMTDIKSTTLVTVPAVLILLSIQVWNYTLPCVLPPMHIFKLGSYIWLIVL